MMPARRKSKPSSCLRSFRKCSGGASASMPTRMTPVCLMRPSTPVRGAALDPPEAGAGAGADAGLEDDEDDAAELVLVPLGIRFTIVSRYVQPAYARTANPTRNNSALP